MSRASRASSSALPAELTTSSGVDIAIESQTLIIPPSVAEITPDASLSVLGTISTTIEVTGATDAAPRAPYSEA